MKNQYQSRATAPDQELATEILKWAPASGQSARMPAQGWLLGFQDARIERIYLDSEHRRNRKYYALSLSIVTLLVASFIWTDPWLLPAAAISTFRIARIYLLVPLCLLLAINATWIANPIAWTRQCAVLLILFGLVHPLLLLISGIEVFEYLELGMMQVILGAFLLMGLPVRWSLPITVVFGLSFGASILRVQSGVAPFANFSVDFIIYASLGAFAAYRYENASRREFIAQVYSRKEYAERLAADTDRRRWLEVIAAFLRHELKNSMTAISTSIEMADRVAPHSDAGKYLERGRRSVQYMHQLLTKVADATNLESALAQHEFEPIDLSKLVLDRIDDFRKDNPERVFVTDVQVANIVLGHGDSLVQMLDKLLNNAIEHADPIQPISVALQVQSRLCIFTVSDIGDALPADTSQIFEPFVSQKSARAGAANLGLGLFVARAIAINHGGNIRAEGLIDGVGARFIVQLPRFEDASSRRNPPIAAAALGSNAVEGRIDP
jgi:signal transduction histidine kinase